MQTTSSTLTWIVKTAKNRVRDFLRYRLICEYRPDTSTTQYDWAYILTFDWTFWLSIAEIQYQLREKRGTHSNLVTCHDFPHYSQMEITSQAGVDFYHAERMYNQHVTKPALALQLPLPFVDEAIRLFPQRISIDDHDTYQMGQNYKYLVRPGAMAAKLLVDSEIMLPRLVMPPELRKKLLRRIDEETNHWFKELNTPYDYRLSRYGEKYWIYRPATGEDVEGCNLDLGNGPYQPLPYTGWGGTFGRFVHQALWWLY